MAIRVVRAPSHVQFGRRLTEVPVSKGLEDVDALYDELLSYTDVLLGRVDPPVDSPYLSLMEIASAYHARALEIEMMILWEESHNRVIRGHPLYKFRTGQLRSFIEMSKKMADLGSRRLTQEALLSEQRYDAGDNY
jgi:hypothetical protein